MGGKQGWSRYFVTESNKDRPAEEWWKVIAHCMGEVRSSSEGDNFECPYRWKGWLLAEDWTPSNLDRIKSFVESHRMGGECPCSCSKDKNLDNVKIRIRILESEPVDPPELRPEKRKATYEDVQARVALAVAKKPKKEPRTPPPPPPPPRSSTGLQNQEANEAISDLMSVHGSPGEQNSAYQKYEAEHYIEEHGKKIYRKVIMVSETCGGRSWKGNDWKSNGGGSGKGGPRGSGKSRHSRDKEQRWL